MYLRGNLRIWLLNKEVFTVLTGMAVGMRLKRALPGELPIVSLALVFL
jgi:hypothetical protein